MHATIKANEKISDFFKGVIYSCIWLFSLEKIFILEKLCARFWNCNKKDHILFQKLVTNV